MTFEPFTISELAPETNPSVIRRMRRAELRINIAAGRALLALQGAYPDRITNRSIAKRLSFIQKVQGSIRG